MLTSVKVFDAQLLRKLELKASGRDLDTEIAAKLALRQEYVLELPVDYSPRTRSQGKKITLANGLKAFWMLLRCRILRSGTKQASFAAHENCGTTETRRS